SFCSRVPGLRKRWTGELGVASANQGPTRLTERAGSSRGTRIRLFSWDLRDGGRDERRLHRRGGARSGRSERPLSIRVWRLGDQNGARRDPAVNAVVNWAVNR